MAAKNKHGDAVSELFRLLDIGTDEKRQQYRMLAELGQLGMKPKLCRCQVAETTDNTMRDEDYAELERSSE